MGSYHHNIHHRRSIRLKGYDYSQAGFYFLTICVQGKECLFGSVSFGTIVLNEAGKMIEKWYWKLESKFPDVKCHQMVVMPNHFHCIIQKHPVGADPCVCPAAVGDGSVVGLGDGSIDSLGDGSIDSLGDGSGSGVGKGLCAGEGEHMGSPLRAVVQWFKTMTTNEYIREVKNDHWPRFNGKLWQRNYYEHIIRNERSFENISEYIINNP